MGDQRIVEALHRIVSLCEASEEQFCGPSWRAHVKIEVARAKALLPEKPAVSGSTEEGGPSE